MPPRYAYWTIIIDDAPTAFRARDREELMPTFRQLQRHNPNATLKWFSKGRLWESPEEARTATRPPREPRGPDWRPGGKHQDPRARFDKRGAPGKTGRSPARAAQGRASGGHRPSGERPSSGRRPPSGKRPPSGNRPQERRPWSGRDRKRAKGGQRKSFDRDVTARQRPGNRPNEGEPPAPPPPRPPGPDRPPRPGEEPRPSTSEPETIRILPEPPERAK